MGLASDIQGFIDGTGLPPGARPNLRYASFDYCFNYFQAFHEQNNVAALAAPEHLQQSCLHLGFYLASWGMYRGSADLLQRSARHLVPPVEAIAGMNPLVWAIDADCYTDTNIAALEAARKTLEKALRARKIPGKAPRAMSDTLFTKIMLGVFGCVPAFDTYFRSGLGSGPSGPAALARVGEIYANNKALIDHYRIPTRDFLTGEPTHRRYTRAKVIDMAFFIKGLRSSR